MDVCQAPHIRMCACARRPAAILTAGHLPGTPPGAAPMQTLVALVVAHGTLLVFVATLAARLGAPVPAAPALVVAGGLAAGGQLSWPVAFFAAIVANIIGDAAWYWAGRAHGYRVLRLLCRISLSPDSCVRQSEAFILRWGGSSLVAAKFVPGVSVVAPRGGLVSAAYHSRDPRRAVSVRRSPGRVRPGCLSRTARTRPWRLCAGPGSPPFRAAGT